MVTAIEPLLHEQLIDRRHRLEAAVDVLPSPLELTRLLEEVDAALRRIDTGVFGLCEVCHDPIETERLLESGRLGSGIPLPAGRRREWRLLRLHRRR